MIFAAELAPSPENGKHKTNISLFTQPAVPQIVERPIKISQAEGTKTSDLFVVGVSDSRINKWEASVNAQSTERKNKVLMYGWWKYDWRDQTIPIAAIDKENLNITSAWSAFLYVCSDGKLRLWCADVVDIAKSGKYDSSAIKLNNGQIIKTFLWKWDGLIPVIKCTSYLKQ